MTTTGTGSGWRVSQSGQYWLRDLADGDFAGLEVHPNDKGGYDLFWVTWDGPKWKRLLGHYGNVDHAFQAGHAW